MNVKDLEVFAKAEIKKLESEYGEELDKEKDIWAYALKVGEELGEVYDALLSQKGYQRKDKARQGKEDLAEEIADVILTTIILSKALEIGLEKALEKKCKKLSMRH